MTFNKKGQEEVAGFVAIVVIISIIGLILIGFSIKDEPTIKEGNDERKLLESVMELTTDCVYHEPAHRNVKDLLYDCYTQPSKMCLNGKSSCTELNQTIKGVIESAYPIGEEFKRKGFTFKADYNHNSSREEYKTILFVQKGNCTSGYYVSADYPFSVYPGQIITKINICY